MTNAPNSTNDLAQSAERKADFERTPERNELLERLARAQKAKGNRDHNVLAGAQPLPINELRDRVAEAEQVASRN